ncbi:MAG: DUF1572 family protein [Chitinophagaceae bacterium]|nr:DUF1572 family protein [Chitinophagaceae bacterium]
MNLSQHIAKQFNEIYFGGNWTDSNIKDNLKNVTWQQATTKIDDLNTIASLVFHMNYYVRAGLEVLLNNTLNAHDKLSFDCPAINNENDWEELLKKSFNDAELLTTLIEKLPEIKLADIFIQEKYGNYYRNLNGIIQHCHYHLGQIVIIKKILEQRSSKPAG